MTLTKSRGVDAHGKGSKGHSLASSKELDRPSLHGFPGPTAPSLSALPCSTPAQLPRGTTPPCPSPTSFSRISSSPRSFPHFSPRLPALLLPPPPLSSAGCSLPDPPSGLAPGRRSQGSFRPNLPGSSRVWRLLFCLLMDKASKGMRLGSYVRACMRMGSHTHRKTGASVLVGRTGPRPACAFTCQRSQVSVVDHCPVWLPQPGHPKAPMTRSLCLQAGGTCFICRRYLRAGPPGSATRSTCQAAKLYLLVPSTATVPSRHPSKCVSRHCPGPHMKASLTSFQPPACPWTVTSRKHHLTPAGQPHQALTLQGSAACPWFPTTSPWRMAH